MNVLLDMMMLLERWFKKIISPGPGFNGGPTSTLTHRGASIHGSHAPIQARRTEYQLCSTMTRQVWGDLIKKADSGRRWHGMPVQ